VTSCPKFLNEQTVELRENLYDWLICVAAKLKLSEKTFILTTEIVDAMLQNSLYSTDELFRLNVVALFTASKYEEVSPISMQLLVSTISKNKFTKGEVLETELSILKRLKFKMPQNLFLDFSHLLIEKMLKKSDDAVKSNINTISVSIHKMGLLNYYVKRSCSLLTFYFAVVYLSCKLSKKLYKYEFSTSYLKRFATKVDVKMEDVLDKSYELFDMIKDSIRYEFLYDLELKQLLL